MIALRSGERSWRRGSNVFPVLTSGACFRLIAGWERAEVHQLASRRPVPAHVNKSVPVSVKKASKTIETAYFGFIGRAFQRLGVESSSAS